MKKKQKHGVESEVMDATAGHKPKFELSEDQTKRIRTFAGVALSAIAAAGVIGVAAVAPNLFSALGKIARDVNRKSYSYKEKQKKTARVFYYLKRHSLIELYKTDSGLIARLTERGKREWERLYYSTLRVKHQKKWDKSFWLVGADIPTKEYKRAADLFRKKLKYMGFYPLQRTLWVYPYNPAAEIQFLVDHFNIGKFVTVMGIHWLDRQDIKTLKRFFDL